MHAFPSTGSLTDVIKSDTQGQQTEVQIPPQELLRPKLQAPQLVNHTCASAWVSIHMQKKPNMSFEPKSKIWHF